MLLLLRVARVLLRSAKSEKRERERERKREKGAQRGVREKEKKVSIFLSPGDSLTLSLAVHVSVVYVPPETRCIQLVRTWMQPAVRSQMTLQAPLDV